MISKLTSYQNFVKVNKWKMLLQHYHEINLSEKELILIMLVMHFSSADRKWIDIDYLAQYCSYEIDDINETFYELCAKKLANIEFNNGKLSFKFDLLFEKIFHLINQKEANNTILNQEVLSFLEVKLPDHFSKEQCYELALLIGYNISMATLKQIIEKMQHNTSFNELQLALYQSISPQKQLKLTEVNWLKDD